MKIPMIPDKGVREATEKGVGGGGGRNTASMSKQFN